MIYSQLLMKGKSLASDLYLPDISESKSESKK